MAAMPQTIEHNLVGIDFRQTLSERPSESDAQIVESENYPLHIGDGTGKGLLVDLLLDLPVVAIPHANTPKISLLCAVVSNAEDISNELVSSRLFGTIPQCGK